MNTSTVSIVMPAFNAAATIQQSIESVVAQTHQDWTLWIVDDQSTDDTSRIVQRFAEVDRRIRLIRNETRSGVARSRNRAISSSQSDYIAFLDSDDLWLPGKLSRQLDAMQRSNSVACCSAYEIVDAQGQRTGQVRVPPREVTYRKMLAHNRIGCLTLIYSVSKIGKFTMPEDVRQEDYLTWLAIIRQTGQPILGLPDTLACYRTGRVSLSSNKISAARSQWVVYRDVLKLNPFLSIFYFVNYAIRNFVRALKESRYRQT